MRKKQRFVRLIVQATPAEVVIAQRLADAEGLRRPGQWVNSLFKRTVNRAAQPAEAKP